VIAIEKNRGKNLAHKIGVTSSEILVLLVREFGMFVKHCKVEIYYTEFLLAELSRPELTVKRKFSKADTLGQYCYRYFILLGH
jgi:hypothetical protein